MIDDYISRETVLKKLQMQLLDLEVDQDKGEYSELCENRGAREALEEAIYDIRVLKAADVQPVIHAYWIELPKALNTNENPCKCSNCGHVLSFMNYYPKSKYCPNCGARMDGDAE